MSTSERQRRFIRRLKDRAAGQGPSLPDVLARLDRMPAVDGHGADQQPAAVVRAMLEDGGLRWARRLAEALAGYDAPEADDAAAAVARFFGIEAPGRAGEQK